MVKLCTHHQKQFIRVLNDLYTESQPGAEDLQCLDSAAMDASSCNAGCAQLSSRHEKDTACLAGKSPASVDLFLNSLDSQSPLHTEETPPKIDSVDGRENTLAIVQKESSELTATQPNSGSSADSSTEGHPTASDSSSLNFHHGSKSLEGQTTGQEQDTNVKTCEQGKDHMHSSTLVESLTAVKVVAENTEVGDGCIVSQRNSLKALSEEPWDSGFMGNSPGTADKENALQCSSKPSLHQDLEANEQDARPKQENNLHSLGRSKVGYQSHPNDKGQFDHSKDGWLAPSPVPAVPRASNGHSRTKMIPPSIKTARKSKRASGLRINDYDNQCDVVYISQPITECHFENQRSMLSSRKTARKSTRGYFFNGDCCELPTVRTLARNLHSQEKGRCSPLVSDAEITPKQTLAIPGSRHTDVQFPGEDSLEEPRVERTSLEEGGGSTSFAEEHQEPAVCPSMAEPVLSSSPGPVVTAPCSPVCPMSVPLPDEDVPDMPEDSTVVSTPTASVLSSTVQDQPSAALLGVEDVQAVQDCYLASTAESGSRGGSEDVCRPQSSPETTIREESSQCSKTESPSVGLDPPQSLEQAEHKPLSSSTEAKTTDILLETPVPDVALQEHSAFTEANPSETEVAEAARGTEAEGEDSDLKYSPENDLAEQSTDSPEECVDKTKKGKKLPGASDRCLRSQVLDSSSADRCLESQSSASFSSSPEIKVSTNSDIKGSEAEGPSKGTTLEGSAADSMCTEDLEDTENPTVHECSSDEETEQDGKGSGVITRQTFKNMLTKEVKKEEEELSPRSDLTATGGQPLPGERLEIYVQSKVYESDAQGPSGNIPCKKNPEQLEERLEGMEAIVNEEDSKDTHCRDDTGFASSGSTGKSGSQSSNSAGPPKLVTRPKRLPSSTYNLRYAHSGDASDTSKVTLEKIKPVPKKEASECAESLDEDDVDTVVEEQPKFVEWCAEEENQELIANFNAQYLRVQKGWIQLEKEAQPTARARSKSDKLKEIWKSKKRSRKCRGPLEGQKFSPVQMLFMTNFKLSNICKWFLETTETRSLVIVKKLNTRLPGDIPPVKHPLQKFSPSSLYPSSLQAERLKKHLKKFPGATPARNNWKTQKLWAKLRENPDQVESEADSDVTLGPSCEDNKEEIKEGRHNHPTTSLPTPASTRILRKYSNIRGKLRAQQRLIKSENTDSPLTEAADSKQSRKSVCINPLMSPKLALQVGADGFPVNPRSAERIKAGRKGKHLPEVLLKAEGQNKRKRTEGSNPHDSKHKRLATKARKEKHVDIATRKATARDRINQLPRKTALKENKAKIRKRAPRKRGPPSRKGRESTSRRSSQPAAASETLRSMKPKGSGEASRPRKARSRSRKLLSSGKTRARVLTKSPENRAAQRKRKLKAKLDSNQGKRRRLDAK